MLKPLIEFIIKSLVDRPEMVEVNDTLAGTKLVLSVKVADEDLGRIIGKDGQTIRALRLLAQSIHADHDVSIDIIK